MNNAMTPKMFSVEITVPRLILSIKMCVEMEIYKVHNSVTMVTYKMEMAAAADVLNRL